MCTLQAFLYSDQQEMVLGPSAFQGPHLALAPSLHAEQALLRQASSSASGQSKLMQQLAEHTAERYTHGCHAASPEALCSIR